MVLAHHPFSDGKRRSLGNGVPDEPFVVCGKCSVRVFHFSLDGMSCGWLSDDLAHSRVRVLKKVLLAG